jgi:DNA adenine methylase
MSRYRTPLRYPGGKQRLAPFFSELLEANDAIGWSYVEPYAGGAGVAMELLLQDKVSHVYLNDCSRQIYAFWKAILNHTDKFCNRISRASLTVEAWKMHRNVVRHPERHDLEELGFSTFFLNRCNRSGVLTGGVIGGLAQEGTWRIDARFPRNELIQRIELIARHSKRMTVTNLDAERFMLERVPKLPAQTIVYCDPPYYQRSKRLYLDWYQREDHVRLARLIQSQLRRPWVVSYDGHPDIMRLYGRRRNFSYTLQYSATAAYAGKEVFVFADRLRVPETSTLRCIAYGLKRLRRSSTA